MRGLADIAEALAQAGFHLFWLPFLFVVPRTLSGLAWGSILPPGTAIPCNRFASLPGSQSHQLVVTCGPGRRRGREGDLAGALD